MATIETPPQIDPPSHGADPLQEQAQREASRTRRMPSRYAHLEEEEFHLLVSELRDDATRSRMREALWISIILHMLVLMFVRFAPQMFPGRFVSLATPQDMLSKQHDLTYLDLPPDLQKAKPVPTDKISDKNRIAQARNPQPNRKQLDKLLRDNRRPGMPAPQPQQQPAQQQMAQAAPQQNASHDIFKTPATSVGSAIQQAARASAQNRNSGFGGDYGSGPGVPNTTVKGSVDILSDTQGVDFGPYLERVKYDVQRNWYANIPEVARPPLRKQGRVVIQFIILPDGRVEGMKLDGPSGDVSLDRGAWSGITLSNPLPALPKEFHGPFLALRFYFYYNPDHGEVR